ncbi:MAG: hypothetical protein R3F54_01075 [Alphaproteobacteria bacterium]
MIAIGGQWQARVAAASSLLPKLAAGETVKAHVLSQNRHGIEVRIGTDSFQLDIPSRFADAKILTLHGAGLSSTSGQRVTVVEKDGQPLPKAISADLTIKPQSSPSAASTIVQRSEIEVRAQPLSSEGQALGGSVTLRLQVSVMDKPSGTVAPPPPTPAETKPSQPSDVHLQIPASTHRLAASETGVSTLPRTSDFATQGLGPNENERDLTTPGGNDTKVPGLRAAVQGQVPPNAVVAGSGGEGRHVVREGAARDGRSQTTTPAGLSGGLDGSTTAIRNAVGKPVTPGASVLQAQQMITSADGEMVSTKGAASPVASIYRPPAIPAPALARGSVPQTSIPSDMQMSVEFRSKMTATVIDHGQGGKPILEAEGQRLRIEQAVDLPLGTILQATVIPNGSVSASPIDPDVQEDPATLLNKLVELLDDIDRAGRQAAEQDRSGLTKQLPQPDKHLAARFLGLLTSAGQHQSERPLQASAAQNEVSAAQKDQIQALVRELGSSASEPLTDGWKSLTLPLGLDQSQAVALYFREQTLDPDGESTGEEGGRNETQRAVFDVSFSRLGRCQIDALCQERRFDLLIRSESTLPGDDQDTITTLFASSCEISGMHGEIAFKVGSFFEAARSPVATQDFRT